MDAMDHYGGYEFVMDDEEPAIEELAEFTRRGGGTICEVTLDEIGRNPRALIRIAKAAEVHILMGCGWYREFGYPKLVEQRTSRELVDILVREIEVGVGDTNVRAGFIGRSARGGILSSPPRNASFAPPPWRNNAPALPSPRTRRAGVRSRSNSSRCSVSSAPTFPR
jgi:phosphotriesterase-related protein